MLMFLKLSELLLILKNDGIISLYHRIRKSWKLRWHQWHGQNLNYRHGWRSKRPILVIESDDWGAEHIPGSEVIAKMKGIGLLDSDSHSIFDGLETADDVDKLCGVLSSYKDGDGNPAVMTANFIMANPDYLAIKNSGYSGFISKPIDSGWNHETEAETLLQKYREGIKAGLIVPQLHGMLHFCANFWMENLRRGDQQTLKAFDLQMIGEKEDTSGIGIQSMSPIYHSNPEEIKQLIYDGTDAFNRIFAKYSITTIAPCYGWRSDETEELFLSRNVLAMQGREYQHQPDGSMKLHYLGEYGVGGILYLVRNCILEPIGANTTIEQCVSQIIRAFQHGLPAILCSHRINYTSRVSSTVRDKGLAVLDGVLKQVTKKYGDVEFMSSDKLALRILSENQSDSFV